MIFIGCLLFLAGLALGSFANASVWRMYQQAQKKQSKNKELSILHGRSLCERCGHKLSALDLIPVLSWIWLRGRCRYCKKSVSWQHPVIELVNGALFVISLYYWPFSLGSFLDYVLFGLWSIAVTIGLALVIYDLKWMILPTRLIYLFGVAGLSYAAVIAIITDDLSLLSSSIIGCAAFGGLFYLMYQISKGRWIGGGDVRLGFALGLLLGWQKSIFALTLAAYLGTLVIIILMIIKKYHKKMKLPFGPFLLSAAFIAVIWGQSVIDWYLRISGLY